MKTEYTPNWDFYFTEIDDQAASMYVDLALNRIAPVKDKNHLLTLEVVMNSPQDNGLSSSPESEILFKIEDKIAEKIIGPYFAIFAGRETCDGFRVFYFYTAGNKEIKKTVKAAMGSFPDYEFNIYYEPDAKWEKYFKHLYPTKYELHTIMNRHVVENLRSKGDVLTEPREVDHYIYFKKEELKNSFIAEVKKMDYKVTSERKDDNSKDFPLSVRITKIDPVTYDDVIDYTSVLFDLAEEYEGSYDGWETKLVTNSN